MSDPYPPQQPGFQPQGGPTSPNPYDPSSQPTSQPYGQQTPNPYGQPTAQPYGQSTAQPYGQPTMQPYGQSTAQPYGQPAAQPYGQPTLQPYGQSTGPYGPSGPQRPGAATGASVLGIVSGSLGIILGFAYIAGLSAMQVAASVLGVNEGLYTLLRYFAAFGTFLAAVALLVGGIMFLKGKGYPVLLYGAFAQAALSLIDLITSLMNKYAVQNGLTYLGPVIGLGMAGFTIYLLFTPVAKRWKQ